jgi:hypothetical protein
MKIIKIYEPAMCCASGVCGPSVDPELLRISSIVQFVNKEDVRILRYNLKDHPMEFVQNPLVHRQLTEGGVDVLPLVVLNDEIIQVGGYPNNATIAECLDMDVAILRGATSTPPKLVKPKIKLSELKVRVTERGDSDGKR